MAGSRQTRPRITTAVQAVATAVGGLTPTTQDTAAVQLALRYGALIDAAEAAAADAEALLSDPDVEPDVKERVRALAARVEASRVLSDLGPKLLGVLMQLGLTPLARASKTGKGAEVIPGGTDPLAAIRARRKTG